MPFTILHFGAMAPIVLSIAIALLVIVGWHINSPVLIQIHPSFVPMQYNTAVCFLLCGLGGLAKFALNHRASIYFVLPATAIAVTTLFQYIFGVNLGIDQIFMQHYIEIKTSHPGRMAPNTAVCFLLISLAVLLPQLTSVETTKYWLHAVLTMLVVALSAVAFFGYFSKIEAAYGWGNLTRMALHTSIAFLLIGIGSILFLVIEIRSRKIQWIHVTWQGGIKLLVINSKPLITS